MPCAADASASATDLKKICNWEDIRKVPEDDWALDGSTYDAYSNFFCSEPQVKLNEYYAQFEFLEENNTWQKAIDKPVESHH